MERRILRLKLGYRPGSNDCTDSIRTAIQSTFTHVPSCCRASSGHESHSINTQLGGNLNSIVLSRRSPLCERHRVTPVFESDDENAEDISPVDFRRPGCEACTSACADCWGDQENGLEKVMSAWDAVPGFIRIAIQTLVQPYLPPQDFPNRGRKGFPADDLND